LRSEVIWRYCTETNCLKLNTTKLDCFESLDNLYDRTTQHQFSLRINHLIDFNRVKKKIDHHEFSITSMALCNNKDDKICSIMANY